MKRSNRLVSVILAAGKGTRMNAPYLPKVCFPIDGRPVIARAIETYQRCGVTGHFVVVGPMAEQVMQAASIIPANLNFCFQPEQRGTGNAARAAAKVLEAMGYEDDVLVVAGDKVIEDEILRRLIKRFRESAVDLAFLVGDVNDFPDSGRIVCADGGRILGNVEVFDIARMQLLTALRRMTAEGPVSAQEAESLALFHLKQQRKAALALGELWDSIKGGEPVTAEVLEANFAASDFVLRVNEEQLSPDLLANVRSTNISVYLFKAPALYRALRELSSDNAQQEEYLTDAIGILSSRGASIELVPIDYPQQVMAFNTIEELREIERHLTSKTETAAREEPKSIRGASEWLRIFETAGPGAIRSLTQVYGEGSAAIEGKRRLILSALTGYIEHFGDGDVLIARAPGRVNIMGRHVDHQGGHGNMIAIDRDIYLIVGARGDRKVQLRSVEPHHFPDRTLDIDDLVADYHDEAWIDFVDSDAVRARIAAAHGDWSQYVAAALVGFQVKYPDHRLQGMNLVASGDIPIAAGLSSSSAVVVACAEAIVGLNGINVAPEQFVEHCGEGEWYVGTRGGAGDQGAMKFAQKGRAVQVGFFPFGVVDTVGFPADYEFVIVNSHEKARKTQGAKDVFNHRVACYNIGRELLRQEFAQFASTVEHLRDFSASNLGVTCAELLEMLKVLPVSMSRSDVEKRLKPEQAQRYLSTHSEWFESYPVRPVVIFGLAECERSRMCPKLLNSGAVEEYGRWMNISHDGDRVVRWDAGGNSWPFSLDYSDAGMDKLIESSKTGGDSFLALQPGAYACSIPRIDLIVDTALSARGVLGAQILGAGLGGVALVLVDKDSRPALERALIGRYYEPAELEPEMFACSPVAGSGTLNL